MSFTWGFGGVLCRANDRERAHVYRTGLGRSTAGGGQSMGVREEAGAKLGKDGLKVTFLFQLVGWGGRR